MVCFKYILVISGHYINYHRLDGLNNIYFSQYGGWKVPAVLVSGEGSLPGLQMAVFTVPSHGGMQRGKPLSSLSFKRILIP